MLITKIGCSLFPHQVFRQLAEDHGSLAGFVAGIDDVALPGALLLRRPRRELWGPWIAL